LTDDEDAKRFPEEVRGGDAELGRYCGSRPVGLDA
jgi:hypothetical protein